MAEEKNYPPCFWGIPGYEKSYHHWRQVTISGQSIQKWDLYKGVRAIEIFAVEDILVCEAFCPVQSPRTPHTPCHTGAPLPFFTTFPSMISNHFGSTNSGRGQDIYNRALEESGPTDKDYIKRVPVLHYTFQDENGNTYGLDAIAADEKYSTDRQDFYSHDHMLDFVTRGKTRKEISKIIAITLSICLVLSFSGYMTGSKKEGVISKG